MLMLNTYFKSQAVIDYTNTQLAPIPHVAHLFEFITITTQDVSEISLIDQCTSGCMTTANADLRISCRISIPNLYVSVKPSAPGQLVPETKHSI